MFGVRKCNSSLNECKRYEEEILTNSSVNARLSARSRSTQTSSSARSAFWSSGCCANGATDGEFSSATGQNFWIVFTVSRRAAKAGARRLWFSRSAKHATQREMTRIRLVFRRYAVPI